MVATLFVSGSNSPKRHDHNRDDNANRTNSNRTGNTHERSPGGDNDDDDTLLILSQIIVH